MKLISVVQARSIWAGHVSDLNPRGLAAPELVSELKQRYDFQVMPPSVYVATKTNQVASFEAGSFLNKAGDRIAVTLFLAYGYIAADTRSTTADCDEFLHDVMTWMTERYGIPDYKKIFTNRLYISNLHISFSKPLDAIHPKLAKFSSSLSKAIQGFPPGLSMELGVIQFWPDTTINPKPVPFRVERQEGTKPSDNRFFSGAPATTETHLKLLEEFEELLT